MTGGIAVPVSPAAPSASVVGAAARQGALNLAGVVWAGIAGFVLVVVLTRGLGTVGYGALATALALHTILTTGGKLGADTGLLREIPRLRAQGRGRDVRAALVAALGPVVLLGAVLAVLVVVAAGPLAEMIVAGERGEAETAAAIRALAPFLAISSATVVAVVATRGFGNGSFSPLVQHFGIPSVRLVLVLAVVLSATGPVAASRWAAVAWGIPLVVALVACLVHLLLGCRQLERLPDALPGRAASVVRSGFWRFTRARAAAGTLEAVTGWAGVLLVSALRGAEDAGVYGAVTRYTTLGLFALQAVRVALGPQVAALLAQGRRDDATIAWQAATGWLVLLAWPFYLLLAGFAATMLSLLGGGFQEGATALVVLSACQLVAMAFGNVTLVLLMSGHSGWNLVNVVASLTTSLVLTLLLVPRFGVTGAAVAWGAAIVLESALATIEVRVLVGAGSASRSSLTAMVVAAGCFGAVPWIVRSVVGDDAAALAWSLALAVPTYLLVVWVARRTLRLDEAFAAVRRRKERLGAQEVDR